METEVVSKPVTGLAALLADLHQVLVNHGAQGDFYLLFAPQQIVLPEGMVLVQQVDASGTITLVPTRIEDCGPEDVLHDTQVFDLGDCTYIQFAQQPGRLHACNLIVRVHQHRATVSN